MTVDRKVVAQQLSEKPTLEMAVELFAQHDCSMPLRRQALSVLIGEKYIPKKADDVAIERGLWRLLLTARAKMEVLPADRLMALGECMRFGQVVKRMAPMIATQLQSVFDQPLPAMSELSDADDRLNVARAFSIAPPGVIWVTGWLARAIAEEETGEKARAEMLATLLARSDSLEQAVNGLVVAFSALRPETESPGDSLGRRLTRTLMALRPLLLESEIPAGKELGNALFELLVLPIDAVGKPETDKALSDLCEEVLLIVHDAVRSRVSLITDAQLYQVLAYCKRLCGGRTWPTELDKPRRRLLADVSEALLLLGKQGQRDQQLLAQISVLANSSQEANAIAQSLAQQHPELPEHVRDWLMCGRIRELVKVSASVQEFASSNADDVLGLALGIVQPMENLCQSLAPPLLDALSIYEPSLMYGFQQLLEKTKTLAVLVTQAADLRKVALYGEQGREVQASAKYFDVLAGAQPRQHMVVRQPAVVRLRSDKSIGEVLVRGVVE